MSTCLNEHFYKQIMNTKHTRQICKVTVSALIDVVRVAPLTVKYCKELLALQNVFFVLNATCEKPLQIIAKVVPSKKITKTFVVTKSVMAFKKHGKEQYQVNKKPTVFSVTVFAKSSVFVAKISTADIASFVLNSAATSGIFVLGYTIDYDDEFVHYGIL